MKRKTIAKGATWFVLLASLAATLPAWQRLDVWIQSERDKVWAQFEDAVGQRITYDRIAPNVLSWLDFQNVRVVGEGATIFHAASVRLTWDWGLLFQGRWAQAFRRVQIINAEFDLDAQRDAALFQRWQSMLAPGSGKGGGSLGFQVEGFNLSGTWRNGASVFTVSRAFVVLTPEQQEWALRFRGALDWENRGQFARMATRGELRGDSAFRHFSVRTELSQFRSTWLDLEPVTLQATVDPDQVTLVKVEDLTPLDLQAVWNRNDGTWVFRGVAENFRLSSVARFKTLGTWKGAADGLLSGRFEARPDHFSFSGQASWNRGDLPGPLKDSPWKLQGAVSGRPDHWEFEDFRVDSADAALRFDGSVVEGLPEGTAVLDHWKLPGVGEARGRVTLQREGNAVLFQGQDWTWNRLGTKAPFGKVERRDQGWSFAIQGPWDNAEGASYSVSGLLKGQRVDASVELIALPLAQLREEARTHWPSFDLPPEIWGLEATVRAQVAWNPAEGPSVSVTSFAFHDPLQPDRAGTGSAEWKGRHLELALDPSAWDRVRAAGRLSADWEEDGTAEGALSGTLWDHPFALKGRWVPSDRTLSFSGSPGVEGLLHQNETGWQLQLALQPLTVVPGWTIGFEGEASWAGSQWSVLAREASVTGSYPWNGEAFRAAARVTAGPGTLSLDNVRINDRSSWTGNLSTTWSLGDQPWGGHAVLITADGESVDAEWTVAPGQWHTAFRAALDVTRVPLPVAITGRAAVSGTVDGGRSWSWSAQTSLSEARLGDIPLGFRAQLSGTEDHLSLRAVNLSVSPLRLTDASGELNLKGGGWSLSSGLGLRFGPGDWTSQWKASGTWTPGASPQVSVDLRAEANRGSQRSFPDWSLKGTWSPESWNITMAGVEASGNAQGMTAKAVAPFPVQGEAQGRWEAGGFNLEVRSLRADVDLVKDLVNTRLFAVQSGRAEGDLVVGGNWSDPEVTGTLVLRGLTATSSFLQQALGPVDIPVRFDGHRLIVDPVDVGPGEQTWMVSGLARLDHLLPEEYQFTIQTDTFSVIPARYEYTGISAQGGVTGQFVVQGSPFAVTLGGRLVLQDTVITLKPSDKTSKGDPLGFNSDLTLVTGRKVEFLWPNESLPLLRAATTTGQTLSIRANDLASTWSVNGRLALRTGEINYLNRTFLVKEGQLIFQENQARFDPRIAVRAEWKLREATGPVVISLHAEGTLGTFSPRFDAVPYRTPEELQQLVGTTLALPTDYTKATNVDTALSVATDVGTSFLLGPFEEAVKRNFQLDLFTVRTEILKRGLLNRNAALDAADYLDNTRLFFGKYIGDDFFLQGSLVFRTDAADSQVSTKMVVEPELQMEFQTPLFLLNWTLLPQHPETLFVTDNTVTLRWDWSY